MAGQRLTYIDTAKLLAVYLVIISHVCMGSGLSNFLFSFHVPLFFVLFGYVFTKPKTEKLHEYIASGGGKMVQRILVPYFLLAFILGNAFNPKSLFFVAYGSIQSLQTVTSTHLWFLPCYFVSVMLFNILIIVTKKRKWLLPLSIVLLMGLSAYFDSGRDLDINWHEYKLHFTDVGLSSAKEYFLGFPLALNVAFTGVGFIYIGTIIRNIIETIKDKGLLIISLALFCLLLGIFFFIENNGDNRLIAMSFAQYGIYGYFIITAVSFSILVIIISKYIDNKVFSKYGKYTLSIYAFHLALTFIPKYSFRILNIDIDKYSSIKGFVYGTIIMAVSCMLIPIIRKIDSNLIGERK